MSSSNSLFRGIQPPNLRHLSANSKNHCSRQFLKLQLQVQHRAVPPQAPTVRPNLLAPEDEARDTLDGVTEKSEIYEQAEPIDADWRCEE